MQHLERSCYGRDSSVGRASDRRSEGPRFDPGSRHTFTYLTLCLGLWFRALVGCHCVRRCVPALVCVCCLRFLGLQHLSQCRYGRDSSAGRASDRRSEGPRFDPGSRHAIHCVPDCGLAGFHIRPLPLVAISCLRLVDPPRTRTWNLRLRGPTPYPLGQRAPWGSQVHSICCLHAMVLHVRWCDICVPALQVVLVGRLALWPNG